MDQFPVGTTFYTDGKTMLAITPRDDKLLGGKIEHVFLSEGGSRTFRELALAEYRGGVSDDFVVLTDLASNTTYNCTFLPGQLIRFEDRELERKPWPEDLGDVTVVYIPDPA